MKIVIAGSADNALEIKRKFGEDHEYLVVADHPIPLSGMDSGVIFDFLPETGVAHYSSYLEVESIHIFTYSLYRTLNELLNPQLGESGKIFGFCGWPTFVDRSLLEVSCYRNEAAELQEICKELGTECRIVKDRVGMATPRVISMIINEAYYTVQEGTAEKAAVDQAMKLGTNYPMGPFEWAEMIGLKNVYKLLRVVYEDTQEERYKVCPLLKTEVNLL